MWKKTLNFVKHHPMSLILIGLNLLMMFLVAELILVAILGDPLLMTPNLGMINLGTNISRLCSGILALVLSGFVGVLDYNAVKYFKNPEQFSFKDEY